MNVPLCLVSFLGNVTLVDDTRPTEIAANALSEMAIEFPNFCRRYDATRHCVRFSGYDGAMEKSFFVEEQAIWHLDVPAQKDEAELLKTFDRHREQICKAARRAYEQRREGSYTLTAADFS